MRLCRFSLVVSAHIALAGAYLGTSLVGLNPLASAAWAQEAGEEEKKAEKPDYEAAKQHYMAAEKAAAAKEWGKAAKEYGIAYDITKDAVLFFKLGNAYQLSGDCTRAVEYYDRYLAEAKPSEEYANDTAQRITACKSSLAATSTESGESNGDVKDDQSEVGDSPIAPTLGTEEPEGASDDLPSGQQPSFIDEEVTWQRTAAWTSVGVSVAFLTASAVLGLSAKSREEDLDNLLRYTDSEGRPANFDATVQDRYDSLEEEGEDLNKLSLITLGLAGAGAAAAIVFFVIDEPSAEESEGLSSLTPTITEDSFGVSAGWSF